LFDTLVAAFNKGSLDVPANLFTPRTTFTLNGRSYESILSEGGSGTASKDDPLIRLLARGAAGYRTAAKAVQYALQRPVVTIESLSEPDASGYRTATVRIEGQLRHSQQPFAAEVTFQIAHANGELSSIDAICPERDLAQIAAARQ
jgi:hypothetical protein